MDDFTQELRLSEVLGNQGGRRVNRRPLSRGVTWGISIVAIALILSGLTVAGWAFYQPSSHVGQATNAQADLERQWLDPTIVDPDTPEPPGKKKEPQGPGFKPIAKLVIPSIGVNKFVINGVDVDDLHLAPGHYPDSAQPGKAGNFAVAGHREKGMFWDLDLLKPGQQILVETRTTRYTYTVVSNKVTLPTATAEVSKVPPGFSQGDKLLTLTTCEPKWDNTHRRIIHAELTGTVKL